MLQVEESESTTIAVRDADERLVDFVLVLVALGLLAFVATAAFTWLTRPSRASGRSNGE